MKTPSALSVLLMSQLAIGWQRRLRHLARIEALRWYLEGVKAARLAMVGMIVTSSAVALAAFGFILLHVALLVYVPWTPQAKALAVALLGAAYLVIGVITLVRVSSSRVWMKYSNAGEWMARISRYIE